MKIPNNKIIQIHSYKHNEELHRIWEKVYPLHENDDFIIVGNNKTRVIESDGKSWQTREPAICYFFKNYWFNVIGMIKKEGVQYYCNIASPSIYDGEALKYIDYDLDVMVYPDGKKKILDEREYDVHKKSMKYPERLQEVIEGQLDILIDMIEREVEPFDGNTIRKWYSTYRKGHMNYER